jgi:catechol 2,3-dioxygenase-like lactoylglutathione lyase family enzyme
MDAYVSLITLGVADLERAVAFYRDGLGWPLSSASVEGQIFGDQGSGRRVGFSGPGARRQEALAHRGAERGEQVF